MNTQRKFILCLAFLTLNFSALAGSGYEGQISRDQYITMWKDVAIRHMHEYGIPASITLAQGILESANGNSALARNANNHFGIKCHGWGGDSYFADDDRPNECFRKYSNAAQSYEDHAEFLKTRSRYDFLFEYPTTAYKHWAHGLKKAGYATNPQYGNLLVRIIEDHGLHQFDKVEQAPTLPAVSFETTITPPNPVVHRKKVHDNGVEYIIAEDSDTYYKIAQEFDMGLWQIYKYNDISEENLLIEGDIIYLQPKRKKHRTIETHKVRSGDTIHSIAQQYGIRKKKLMRRNDLESGDLEVGMVLRLR